MADKPSVKKQSGKRLKNPSRVARPRNSDQYKKKIEGPIDIEYRQLLSILDSIDEVVYIADPDTYEILYANKALKKLFGDIAGRQCYSVFQEMASPCPFCTNEYIFGKNLGKSHIWEFQNNKNQKWYRCIDKAIYWPSGKMVRYEMAIDITERKRTEEALRESEELYRTLAEAAQDAIFIIGRDDTVTYVNTSAARLFNKTPENITGKPRTSLFSPAVASKQKRTLLNVFETGKPQYSEDMIPFPKAEIWISTVLAPLLDKAGAVHAVLGISRDITASKEIERKLRESDEKYRDLYDNAPDMYYAIDKNGIIIECNDTQARMLGYKKEEIIGRALPDFFTEDSKRLFDENFPKLNYIKSRIFAERDFVRKDGTVFTASININSQFDQLGAFEGTKTIARDITEMKHAEEALRYRENYLNNILDSIRDGISILDNNLNIVRTNSMMEKWYSHQVPLIGRKCYAAYHGRTSPCEVCPSMRTLDSGEADYETVIYTNPAGARGYMDVYTFPLTDFRTQEMIGVIEYVRDVTSKKNMEMMLIDSEEKYRRLFEDSRDAVYITSSTGRFIDVNQSALDLFGYSKEEMIGMDVLKIYVNHDDRTKFRKEIEKNGSVKDFEIRFCKKNGEGMDCLLTSTLWQDNEGRILGYRGIIRDITEKRRMEKELLKMEKLESIGVLAGGIAHDFNNILTAIMGNIAIAMMYAKPGHELFARLVEAEKASLRARDLTQQLLTFSKGGAPVRKMTSIAELIKDSAAFALRGSNVKCEFSIPDELWPVEIDEGQISQVINNLVINADHAMPQGGTVRISAENIKAEETEGFFNKDERCLKIMVADEGTGIPDEHLQKIFDPYFTTKEKGNGLGLAITYSIINKHDGYITVASEPGTGTTFSIYLPAAKKGLTEEGIKPGKGFFIGKGNILIMDDEAAILDIAGEMLRQIGYDVDFALCGDEAIAKYQRAKEADMAFDAVILDLTVPGGTGGRETLRRLLDIEPDIKAVVSSGYSNDTAMANYREYGFMGVIAKPYKFSELAKVIRDVLEGDSGS